MAYQFSLMDDDEDITAPLLEDETAYKMHALSQSADGQYTVRGGPRAENPPPSPWQPAAAPRDTSLDPLRRQAEQQSLETYTQGTKNEYGLGELARDYGGMGIAAIIDLVANKGKDLPSLLTANQGVVDKNRAIRSQETKAAGDYALRAGAQKDQSLSNELAVRRLQLQEQGLGQQDQRIGIARGAETRRDAVVDRNQNPDNPQQVAAKQALITAGVQPEIVANLDAKGLDDLQHKMNLDMDHANTPRKAGDEAVIGGARQAAVQTAENDANIRDLPRLGEAKGKGSALAEEIERPGVVKTAGATAEAGARGREVVEAPVREQTRSETFSKEFADKHSDILNARTQLGRVLEGVPEGGAAAGTGRGERLAGALGVGGLFNGPDAQANQQSMAAALTTIQHDATGASAGVKEAARIALSVFGDPTASAEDKTQALRRTMAMLDEDIAGLGAARPDDAQKVLNARSGSRKQSSSAPAPAGAADNPWAKYKVR
jgi:hypothetical protein